MTPPTPGLRVVNGTKSPIHASVVIPVGDELEASEYVADQLDAAGLSVSEKPVKPAKKTAAKK